MLLSLSNEHKEHLQLLINQPERVILDFCKLAGEFLQNGINQKKYLTAAQKLDVGIDTIQNCIFGIINLLLLGCKNEVGYNFFKHLFIQVQIFPSNVVPKTRLSEQDFRDSILSLGFTEEIQAVLSKFYQAKQHEIKELSRYKINEPHYHDLQWRFEVQLSSRCLRNQITPLITMDLILKTQSDDSQQITHNLLQTDPTNLVHLCNELENALVESKSLHSRKIQRALSNLQQ
ncbi:COMM domain-containing protein 2-like isoform X1 [Cylas formicarius]|uniref:COMM domain-containing protein 2-like isoform X1 n=1 Tax=Cylas formicarius TaxID=197179 RepID=UPI002958AFAA|nr:COMM domain-containing protein 2-like isoform X1 [Cylas formicarius]XP_060518824.1 COMM domain-containing protein 2-like isoform X1 [Cylas formicarius]